MATLKQQAVKGVFWSSIERFSVQGVQFVIQIIMARLLSPSDYGIIGMLAIFLAVSQSFIDSGFSNALIRKTNRTQEDYSTVFYFNIVVGLFFYLLLFFTSPFIASFYETPLLDPVTKLISVILLINSLTVVQRAKLTINLDFKTQAKASFASVVVSGVIGISMAYYGYGVWALGVQIVINSLLNMLFLWIYSKWKPDKVFSWRSFNEMFSFGSKLLLSGLLDTIYRNIYTIVIGKKFAAVELGYYTRADQFAQLPSSNLTGILQRVTYPVLSTMQDDTERLRVNYRKFLRISAFIIFPLMIGLAAIADPLIRILLTDKWENTVILLQILCVALMWYPIHAINLNLLQVKGRSDLFLKLEVWKKIIGIIVLIITIPMGLVAMCIGRIITSLLALIINTYYTGLLIHLGFFRQMKDLLLILINSLVMGGIVWFCTFLVESNWEKLLLSVPVGVAYIMLSSYFLKSEELKEILKIIRKK